MDGVEGLGHKFVVPLRITGHRSSYGSWAKLRQQMVESAVQERAGQRRIRATLVLRTHVALHAQHCPAAVMIYGDCATSYIMTPSLPTDLLRSLNPSRK